MRIKIFNIVFIVFWFLYCFLVPTIRRGTVVKGYKKKRKFYFSRLKSRSHRSICFWLFSTVTLSG